MKNLSFLIIGLSVFFLNCKKEAPPINEDESRIFGDFDCETFTGFPEIPGWDIELIDLEENSRSNSPPSFYFFGEKKGFIFFGGNDFLKTTDGGRTWEKIEDFSKASITTIDFVNENLGFIAGIYRPANTSRDSLYSKIFKTQNGGITWEEITPNYRGDIRELKMINDSIGFAILYETIPDNSGLLSSKLYKTEDGGTNWNKVSDETFFVNSSEKLKFMSSGFGYVKGSLGNLQITKDFGETWNVLETGLTKIHQAQFFNKNEGFVAGRNEGFEYEILKTIDGGITWIESVLFDGLSIWSIGSMKFVSQQEGFYTKTTGLFYENNDVRSPEECVSIFKTVDGGEIWEQTSSSLNFQIANIQFLNNDHGVCTFVPYSLGLSNRKTFFVSLTRK